MPGNTYILSSELLIYLSRNILCATLYIYILFLKKILLTLKYAVVENGETLPQNFSLLQSCDH
jgi:hypothetical protein